tara:strand:+ start:2638 stop:3192 length:555 start_codon:yes stop_codon:yes gene_type:complete
MVKYVTESELRKFASEIPLSEQTNLRKSAASHSLRGATFLSHSSRDDDLVVGAIRILKNHGAAVYVDEKDPEMPPYTSDETAALLKTRIKETKRFVMLASKNSKGSRWVPWELGCADGYKGLDRIALFPALDEVSDTAWTSSEYLGLYRRIVWGNLEGHEAPLWMVWNQKNDTATRLRDWLGGT